MFETAVSEGVTRLRRPGVRWLSTGFDGGERVADAAYNVTVPEGWDRTDLAAYVAERREAAGFADDGPALLTGVAQRHARGARHGPVEAVVTAGLSNPAPLAADGPDGSGGGDDDPAGDHPPTGTVNVVVGTARSLAPGALPNLVAVAAEAKAATLLRETGFPGTTTDAVVAACDPDGERAAFSGSGTEVGRAARACVRDALRASLASRYADEALPESVAEARHGVDPVAETEVFEP
ncbi:adenosylcobinamide amidohydrolase [Halostella litorea]|uniref:adenosylcobinamide amidohydrolase n=1 Tax=Halostella litorea TaxID=2528831 RepID=UPI0010925A72|nr:adenosylcobinamide amidohydrolase [Halostella litorea]